MTVKRSDLQKILDRDDLTEKFKEVLEQNPDNMVLAFHNSETGETKAFWFGVWPTALGLTLVLTNDLRNTEE